MSHRGTVNVRREGDSGRNETANGRRQTCSGRRNTANARRDTVSDQNGTANGRRETDSGRRESANGDLTSGRAVPAIENCTSETENSSPVTGRRGEDNHLTRPGGEGFRFTPRQLN